MPKHSIPSISRARRLRPGRRALALLAPVLAVGASVGLGTAPAAARQASATGIVYQTHPIARLAVRTRHALPGGLPTASACVTDFGLACYTPRDIRAAYDIPSKVGGALAGTGQTIVIVDAFGSPTVRQDLATFDKTFKVPPPPALNVLCPLGCPTFNPRSGNEVGWAEETSLDVQMAHGIAPGATIDLVVAPSNAGDALNLAEQWAVSQHLGHVMSMSFGVPEGSLHGNNNQVMQSAAILQQAANQGMSVFASAGDSGATNGLGAANALFPASDPNVTAVGGTALFTDGVTSSRSEVTWNDATNCPFTCKYGPFGATGGAPSALFPAPSYQSALSHMRQRTTADVSFNASVYTSVLIYLGFLGPKSGFYFFGGTSEGSPSWAAIAAIADQAAAGSGEGPLGPLNPRLYAIGADSTAYATAFHDSTVGNNHFPASAPGFPAGTGYDLPTGLGSPKVADLINLLIHP